MDELLEQFFKFLPFLFVIIAIFGNVIVKIFKSMGTQNNGTASNLKPQHKKKTPSAEFAFGDLKDLLQNFQEPQKKIVKPKKQYKQAPPTPTVQTDPTDPTVPTDPTDPITNNFNVMNADFFNSHGHQAIIFNEILSKPKALQEV